MDLAPYLDAIEQELRATLPHQEESIATLYQMMQYHMGWLNAQFALEEAPRGKRLRPVLCLLACEATGGIWQRALPAAAAIELIHNFSLLHDDIEDHSETRRHRRTVWNLWGIPQGINTGDAMWAISHLAVYRLTDMGHSASVALRVARLLDETCLELCIGQYLDISFETTAQVSLAQYERMIAGKTAALVAACLATGAILGGAEEAMIASYRALGRELGLTFQITDDILGVWGDPAVTGKSAASDILTKKKALPALYALQWEHEHGYADLAEFYARPQLFPEDVVAVLALLERAQAQEYTHHQAQIHLQRTLGYLQATQINHPAQEALRELALAIINRSS
jgi:geranylgeranyl diphosphate synthase, type I